MCDPDTYTIPRTRAYEHRKLKRKIAQAETTVKGALSHAVSGWRDYDDGSAGDAAKYDDARADDDDYGGNDDDDDRLCPTSRTTILMASAVLK